MTGLFLAGWIAFGLGDAASSHIARDRFLAAHPNALVFGEAPWAVDGQAIYPQVLGGLTVEYLWKHKHKKAAVLVTAADFAWKGYIIHRNLNIH